MHRRSIFLAATALFAVAAQAQQPAPTPPAPPIPQPGSAEPMTVKLKGRVEPYFEASAQVTGDESEG